MCSLLSPSRAAWTGGGGFPDADEADFRAITHSLLGLLVADQWDGSPSHHAHSVPAWIHTGLQNPDPASMAALVGAGGPLPTAGSLLGRVRCALGSL